MFCLASNVRKLFQSLDGPWDSLQRERRMPVQVLYNKTENDSHENDRSSAK
jgi:hypothetical protein